MNDTEKIKQVVHNARKHKIIEEEMIELYERTSMLVYDNQEKYDYLCEGSGLGFGSLDWHIAVPSGKPLPKELGELFFNNVSLKYKVNCKKDDEQTEDGEDVYTFNITK